MLNADRGPEGAAAPKLETKSFKKDKRAIPLDLSNTHARIPRVQSGHGRRRLQAIISISNRDHHDSNPRSESFRAQDGHDARAAARVQLSVFDAPCLLRPVTGFAAACM